MQKCYKTAVILATTICIGATFGTGSHAQTLLPTNLPGVYAVAGPPAGADPINASDETLRAWGLPPRPKSAQLYADWARIVSTPATLVVPIFQRTNRFHKPAVILANDPNPPSSGGNITNAVLSSNWSGIIDSVSASSFGSTSFQLMYAHWNVPKAQQAFGVCSGGWDYSATWFGIDGDGSADVFQGGTASNAYCAGGVTTPQYYAWYEWYPNSETIITNFPINPGDDMVMAADALTSTTGIIWYLNATTNTKTYFEFSAPAGTQLIGNSIEWIVERPTVNGSNATLTNYVEQYFGNAAGAQVNGNEFFGAQPSPSTITATSVTMLDNSGNPISAVQSFGLGAFNLIDEGSAN